MPGRWYMCIHVPVDIPSYAWQVVHVYTCTGRYTILCLAGGTCVSWSSCMHIEQMDASTNRAHILTMVRLRVIFWMQWFESSVGDIQNLMESLLVPPASSFNLFFSLVFHAIMKFEVIDHLLITSEHINKSEDSMTNRDRSSHDR